MIAGRRCRTFSASPSAAAAATWTAIRARRAGQRRILSLGLEIEHDLGFATLTSTTGYKDHQYRYAEDFDATPLAINDYAQDQDGDYLEQEFRLVSSGAGAFSWYAGVSYYQENIDALFIQPPAKR